MNIIQVIHDPHLFRPLFKDLDTWGAWLVFLKALFALKMSKPDLELYHQCTGREKSPEKPFREAWVPTGVRSGKSFTAALVAVFLACFKDYRGYLAPGERAMILIIAADRSQAQVIFRYCKGFLEAIPMLAKMVETERTESLDLANRVTIQVATCSYRSVRGVTCAAVICDEVAFWRGDDGANPATEVLRALRPRLATIPDSILLGISSPYMRSGPLWQAFHDHHGKEDSDLLCWQADSKTMNPTISQALIDRDYALDPEAAASEWGAQFRTDLESFLSPEAIQSVVIPGRYELARVVWNQLHELL
jgi:Terminase large subunit, T4likevirus-type, N-terminal